MKRTRVERGIYLQQNGTYAVYYLLHGKPRYKTVGPEARRSPPRAHPPARQSRARRTRHPDPAHLRRTRRHLARRTSKHSSPPANAARAPSRTTRYLLNHHIIPAFGSKRLQEITTDDIAALIAQMRAKQLAAKTINGALVPIGRILAHALRRGYITDNPLSRLERHERPRIYKRDQRVLDHQQISALLDASLPRYRPLLATAIYTGLRLNELLGLTWADVNLHRRFHPRPLPTLTTHPRQPRPPRPTQDSRRDARHPATSTTRRRPQTPQARHASLSRRRLRLRNRDRHTARLPKRRTARPRTCRR